MERADIITEDLKYYQCGLIIFTSTNSHMQVQFLLLKRMSAVLFWLWACFPTGNRPWKSWNAKGKHQPFAWTYNQVKTDSLQIFIKQTPYPPLSWNLYLSPKVGFSWRASLNLLPTTKKVFMYITYLQSPKVYRLSRGFREMDKISKSREQSDYHRHYNCIFGGDVSDFLVVSAIF